MIDIYHPAPRAARMLAQHLGGSAKKWSQYLKEDRQRRDRGDKETIPFETAFGGGKPAYFEGDVFRFILAQRGAITTGAGVRVPYAAHARASYERGGELGVTLSGPNLKPSDIWLSHDEAIDLALDILVMAKYVVGRRVDMTTDRMLIDPREVLTLEKPCVLTEAAAEAMRRSEEIDALAHAMGALPGGGEHAA